MRREETSHGCVAVLIPTLGRPDSLRRALASVMAQSRKDLISQIIVVDNAHDQSARPVVEGFNAGPAILYVAASPPGVATARNAGLAATRAPYIAFLDDDEEAPQTWLETLFDVHRRYGADVTFGPVSGLAPGAASWKRAYLERFFSRTGPACSGLTSAVYGCGNSLMTRASALVGEAPFDCAADASGGEDDRLFLALRKKSARFAWAADAAVFEHASAARCTLAYAFTRAMAFGQGPARACVRAGDGFGALRWMAVGAGQTAFFSACALGALVLRRADALMLADKAMRGLGKVFWFAPLRFYGAAAAEASPRPARRTVRATNKSQTTSL